MSPTKKKTIAIIGGGASGIFASIRCAEIAKEKDIEGLLGAQNESYNR